jgi:hypothetical protein
MADGKKCQLKSVLFCEWLPNFAGCGGRSQIWSCAGQVGGSAPAWDCGPAKPVDQRRWDCVGHVQWHRHSSNNRSRLESWEELAARQPSPLGIDEKQGKERAVGGVNLVAEEAPAKDVDGMGNGSLVDLWLAGWDAPRNQDLGWLLVAFPQTTAWVVSLVSHRPLSRVVWWQQGSITRLLARFPCRFLPYVNCFLPAASVVVVPAGTGLKKEFSQTGKCGISASG